MNFFTRLFKPKPKGNENYGIAQYLYKQTRELQFQHFLLYQKEITEQEYIIAVDVIIDKMRQWIHDVGSQDQPEWIKPIEFTKKGKRRKRRLNP